MWNSHASAGVPRESKWSITWLKVFKLCPLEFQWGNYLEHEKSKERRWKRNLIICWRLCSWWRKLPDGRIALGLTSLEVLNGGHVDFFWLKDAFTWITSGHRTRWFPKLRSTRVLIVDCFLSYAWKTFTQTTCSGTDARWACWSNFRYFYDGFYDQSLLWFVCFHVNWGRNSDRRRLERVVSAIRLDPCSLRHVFQHIFQLVVVWSFF